MQEGKLYVAVKLEPNVVLFVEEFNKKALSSTDRPDIKGFVAGNDGAWVSKIVKHIKDNSKDICGEDISDWFESSFVESTLKTINPTTGLPPTGADFNEVYKTAVIKTNPKHAYFDQDDFKKFMLVIKSIYMDKSFMSKINFIFNNRNNCVFTYDGSSNNPFNISNKSKRYMTKSQILECEDLRKFLNNWISENV